MNWRFWTVVLEKTPESCFDCKEIKPMNSKGNQPWIFIGRTYTEVESPILWPPDAKSWLNGKDADAGKDWEQEKEWQRMICLDGITDSMGMNLSKLRETEKDREACSAAVRGFAKSWTQLRKWETTARTKLKKNVICILGNKGEIITKIVGVQRSQLEKKFLEIKYRVEIAILIKELFNRMNESRDQCFSNSDVHGNDQDLWLKCRVLGSRSGVESETEFLTSSQVTLVLLVHFHSTRDKDLRDKVMKISKTQRKKMKR